MADSKKDGSSYSEPSYVAPDNKALEHFYRPDISQMLVPAVSTPVFSKKQASPLTWSLRKTRNLLENYSHIPADSQVKHVHEIRDKAWSSRPYPCIGIGAFLVPQLSRLPVYPELVQRLSAGQQFLDIGCFLGSDMRHLVNAGVPSGNLHGIDIVNFWDLGFDMFNDRGRFEAKFTEADMLAAAEDGSFKGKFDVVSVFQVIHQWDWNGQVEACKALIKFCKPNSLIVGNQVGNIKPQEVTLPSLPLPLWRHDEKTFAKLWDEVGRATGTKWEVEAWLRTFEDMEWRAENAKLMEDGIRLLEFVVRRAE